MRHWFAHHAVIDVKATPAEVLARVRERLQGDLGWTSALTTPTLKVGQGPPDYLGQITGRSFRLHTTWRPTFARGHESALEVIGLVEPGSAGARVRAIIRPQPVQYLTWAPAVFWVVVGLLRHEYGLELVIVPAVVGLYWLTVVPRDIHWAARGLADLIGD
jgi:hypothetical protein